jgi:hypothetical protein
MLSENVYVFSLGLIMGIYGSVAHFMQFRRNKSSEEVWLKSGFSLPLITVVLSTFLLGHWSLLTLAVITCYLVLIILDLQASENSAAPINRIKIKVGLIYILAIYFFKDQLDLILIANVFVFVLYWVKGNKKPFLINKSLKRITVLSILYLGLSRVFNVDWLLLFVLYYYFKILNYLAVKKLFQEFKEGQPV